MAMKSVLVKKSFIVMKGVVCVCVQWDGGDCVF